MSSVAHSQHGPRHAARLVLAVACVLILPVRAGDPPQLGSEVVASGLALPIFATAAPGEPDRIYVLEQLTSRIRIVDRDVLLPDPFLDLGAIVSPGGERGLLGLAFHPDYQLNGSFFVQYNDLDKDVVLARYQVDPGDPDTALPGSAQILLTIEKPFDQHNGGTLAFHPADGLLWMSIGDGGDGGDPFNNAQNINTLLGSMLRLDVDGPPPYGIPADNPFVGLPGRDEIYAYGLRNPWRFSIDPQTGWVYLGDVGQAEREEVNRIRTGQPGLNFGWRCMEGTLCTGLGGCPCPPPNAVDPLFEYDHNEGCAIIGGHVYRGDDIPGLRGYYMYGDYCTSKVWVADVDVPGLVPVDVTAQLGLSGFLSSFGLDGRGELLVVGYNGTLYRVTHAEPDADCDGDGASDADEIAAGTEFDVNGNLVPDSCELLLSASDIVKGQTAQLDFLGAQPGQIVAWFGSLRGIGPGPCLFQGNVCLDLLPMTLVPGGQPDVIFLGLTSAGATGTASQSLVVPDVDLGSPIVAFQALAAAGWNSVTSNPVQKVIQD